MHFYTTVYIADTYLSKLSPIYQKVKHFCVIISHCLFIYLFEIVSNRFYSLSAGWCWTCILYLWPFSGLFWWIPIKLFVQFCKPRLKHLCYTATVACLKKGKGRTLDIAPQVTNLRGAQVHGAHKAALHIPALYLPSYSWYSFTDSERMEGWVSPGPGCKEQLAHGCYATARSQWTQTRDLTAAGRAC